MIEATGFGRPQRRARTPPTSAWSTPSSRRSWWRRSSGVRAPCVDLAGVARVGVHEHELADVVQQRGDHQAVAVLVAGLAREAVGGALGGDAVQAEALGRGVPDRASARRSRRCGSGSASAWTASGERSSTDCTTDSTRPRLLPSTWLARRSTVITSATSDSTAATTLADGEALLGDERGAGGCATRPAPGRPRAPRRRRSGAGRGPRCGGERRSCGALVLGRRLSGSRAVGRGCVHRESGFRLVVRRNHTAVIGRRGRDD